MQYKYGEINGIKVVGTPTLGLRGLVLWLKFNEGSGSTAYDSSFYNNHGTIHGATWTQGKFGKALSFDGVDDYVEVPDSESLRPQHVTFAIWLKIRTIQRSVPIGNIDTSGHNGWGFRITEEGYLQFMGGTGTASDGWIIPNYTVETDKWLHWVGVIDGSHKIFYLNGKEYARKDFPYNVSYINDYPFTLGRFPNYNGQYFDGIIDEVRIYNRALSEEEIRNLYKNVVGIVNKKTV